jgi:hypothetical protein
MAYGTINADVIQSSVSGVSLGAGNATRFKNRIINGNMVISQRGTSFTNDTSGSQYSLDRWLIYGSTASKFTVAQSSTAPTGFSNSFLVTSSAATTVGASDVYEFLQRIEGFNFVDMAWGTANAKTITLSFQVYSSLTGTFGGALQNSNNTRSYPFSYSIPTANTWTSISVTIAGDTSGTWIGGTNGTGLQLIFGLGSGSTYSTTAGAWATGNYTAPTGAVQVVATSGATFYITGVQLEVGSSATGFDFRDITTETSLCQRYYWKTITVTSNNFICWAFATSTTTVYGYIYHPVLMRTPPTSVSYSGTGTWFGGAVTAISAIIIPENGTTSSTIACTSSGLTANAIYGILPNGGGNYIAFNAEL